MPLVATREPAVTQALEHVNKAAQADTSGTGQAHSDLIESIRKLTLAVEKPNETLTRCRLEVGTLNYSPLNYSPLNHSPLSETVSRLVG